MNKKEFKILIDEVQNYSNISNELKEEFLEKFITGKNEKAMKDLIFNVVNNGVKFNGFEKIANAFITNNEISEMCYELQKIKFLDYKDFLRFAGDLCDIHGMRNDPRVIDMLKNYDSSIKIFKNMKI